MHRWQGSNAFNCLISKGCTGRVLTEFWLPKVAQGICSGQFSRRLCTWLKLFLNLVDLYWLLSYYHILSLTIFTTMILLFWLLLTSDLLLTSVDFCWLLLGSANQSRTLCQAAGVSCSNLLCQDGYDKCLWAVGSNCSCHRGTPGTAPLRSVMLCPNKLGQRMSQCDSILHFPYALNKFFADWHPSIHLTYWPSVSLLQKRVAAHLSESSTALQGPLTSKKMQNKLRIEIFEMASKYRSK